MHIGAATPCVYYVCSPCGSCGSCGSSESILLAISHISKDFERGGRQNVPADTCSIQADVEGFAVHLVSVVTVADQVAACDFQLGIARVRVGVNVGGALTVHEPKMLPGACRSDTSPRPS